MSKRVLRMWPIVGMCLLAAGCGQVELPAVFSDHAVFQQGREIPVWGTGEPGHRVVVRFAGQTKGAVVGDGGRWIVRLEPVAAGGPHDLAVCDGLTWLRRKDILVGEVWVCSGQSNMEWRLSSAANGPQEVADANYPQIRLLTVPRLAKPMPVDDVDARWTVCRPETAGSFSAVGYFFGRYVHKTLGVPVGLINASWGGSAAEPWTPRRFLTPRPEFADALKAYDDRVAQWQSARPGLLAAYEQAKKDYPATFAQFMEALAKGDLGTKGRWHEPDANAADWKTMDLPQLWERTEVGAFDGIVWFRKEVEVPPAWAGKDLTLGLGPIDDDDVTYFNGGKVGATGYGTPRHWQTPRRYTVPGALVRAGRNVIVSRVLDGGGGGGFGGLPAQMKLSRPGAPPDRALSLAGAWRYRIGCSTAGKRVPSPPRPPSEPTGPSGMYNGMIAPLVPYGIAGAIWYQGESNAGRPIQYRTLFPLMIRGWRTVWQQGDFPFLFVQLANLGRAPKQPDAGGWAWLREAQLRTLALPKTAMAVTIDIGDANDIHPRNKQDVGKRLALGALAVEYGRDGVHSGPIYRSMTVEGNKVRLRFRHVGGGLVAKGPDAPNLKQFSIAGIDQKFVWAHAKIDGETAIVWSDAVSAPAAVRYAWATNPEGANLFNAEGLPASPFRTDDWPR
jgi:sialate O-acetylesterase